LAADDEQYLARQAAEAAARIVTSDGPRVSIDAKAVRALPAALARRLIRHALEGVAPRAPLGMRHLNAVLALAGADNAQGQLDLPQLRVTRAGGRIAIERVSAARANSATAGAASASHALPVPGSVDIAPWRVIATTAAGAATKVESGRGTVATVQVEPDRLPLAVRTWRPGDRFKPLGASGRRKVQDLFVDRKVTRADRHRTPIVVDALGQIVWVAGLAIAHECRVTAPEAGMVILKLKTIEAE
jgi:tRNA(Ile)-lysidine synthase